MSTNNITATIVTADALQRALVVCAKARRPAFVWGSPGIGKSDNVRAVAKLLDDAHVIDWRASQRDAVDTHGIPYVESVRVPDGRRSVVEGKVTKWAAPGDMPSAELCAKHKYVVLYLDELSDATMSVQSALYQLVLDRRLGDYALPDNVVMFASGNLEGDRAAANRMSTALANRFIHFQLAVEHKAWQSWALAADVHVAVISFLRWKADLLHVWDPRSTAKAQATPRTWQIASDLLKTMEAEALTDSALELALMTGTLGDKVGTEFAGFLAIYRKLPDPDSLIMAPDTSPLLEGVDVNYALCGALAKRSTVKNFDRVLKYADRMAAAPHIGPEFSTLLVRTATTRCEALTNTRAFIAWATKNEDVFA
jgi:hypothetical protein